MAKTVIGMYENPASAQQTVSALEDAGIRREDINLIAGDARGEYTKHLRKPGTTAEERKPGDTESETIVGAEAGAVVGGIGGLLIGLGMLAIPGVGPIVAAGPILGALVGTGVGAATGGLADVLVNAGVPQGEAEHYAEGVRGGYTVVAVQTTDDMVDRVVDAMKRYNPVAVHEGAIQGTELGSTQGKVTPAGARFGFHNEGTSLDHQVDRLIASGMTAGQEPANLDDENATVSEDRDTVQTQPPVPTGVDDEAATGGHAGYTHETFTDRSQLPADMLPQAPTPLGDALEATGPDAVDDDFHDHYDAHYATSDFEYVQYQPAYLLGYRLAGEERYRDYDWNQVEQQARMDWERDHAGSPWEQFRDAVHYGWDLRRGMSR